MRWEWMQVERKPTANPWWSTKSAEMEEIRLTWFSNFQQLQMQTTKDARSTTIKVKTQKVIKKVTVVGETGLVCTYIDMCTCGYMQIKTFFHQCKELYLLEVITFICSSYTCFKKDAFLYPLSFSFLG